jgi:hypothetical protein
MSEKDAALIRTFHKRGFKNVILMDRADPTKPFNLKTYRAWLEQGRQVRKGERGYKGLFHVDQTDEVKKAA